MKLLLLSNGTIPGENLLAYGKEAVRSLLCNSEKKLLFIPFAAVRFSFDQYHLRVRERFEAWGYTLDSLHFYKPGDMAGAVEAADGIVTGGGNTFQLLGFLRQYGLLDIIRKAVQAGIPYIGWSAGSNICCPNIGTTNDMPIVDPEGFDALGLVPFQINPHYTDRTISGHGGESRDDRINEFTIANPGMPVIGLREGSWIEYAGDSFRLGGMHAARIFVSGENPREVEPGEEIAL